MLCVNLTDSEWRRDQRTMKMYLDPPLLCSSFVSLVPSFLSFFFLCFLSYVVPALLVFCSNGFSLFYMSTGLPQFLRCFVRYFLHWLPTLFLAFFFLCLLSSFHPVSSSLQMSCFLPSVPSFVSCFMSFPSLSSVFPFFLLFSLPRLFPSICCSDGTFLPGFALGCVATSSLRETCLAR